MATVQSRPGAPARHPPRARPGIASRLAGSEALLDTLPEAVLLLDGDGLCLYANAAAGALMGMDHHALAGLSAVAILERCPGLAPLLHATASNATPPAGGEHVVELEAADRRRRVLAVRHHRLALGRGGPVTLIVARDVTAERSAEARLRRAAAEEQALAELLRLSLADLPMQEYLTRAVDVLLESVPWLELLPGGGIFLNDNGTLQLVAMERLHPALHRLCARIEPGQCLCGRAAATRRIQHAQCVDERHEVAFPGMKPHGHYNVPILRGDELKGVLVLYLPHGRPRSDDEEAFLSRVADVLAMGICGRQLMARRLETLAHQDRLTGLANRDLLHQRVAADLRHPPPAGCVRALLHLDLDHFNVVNNALGHDAGDRVLKRVAVSLQAAAQAQLAAPHVLARLGGDEFALWLPELRPPAPGAAVREVQRLAEALRDAIADTSQGETQQILTACVGIAIASSRTRSADEVLRQAGAAVQHAKRRGRGSVAFHREDMQAQAERRLAVERDLRRALAGNELALYYQPQTDAAGRLLGAEALIRWPHPTRGLVSPGEFIPIAEASELIVDVGRWTLAEACRQIAAWRARYGKAVPSISVNVSALEFHQQGFAGCVGRAIASSGIDPALITLEITEGMVMQDLERVVEKMHALREYGVRIALDDFGTGYSSLSYLKRFPLHEMKIDQSFVRGLPDGDADAAIVDTILHIAQRLRLATVAEGVETESQRDFLAARGCTRLQGYLFDRPLPADTFERCWLAPAAALR